VVEQEFIIPVHHSVWVDMRLNLCTERRRKVSKTNDTVHGYDLGAPSPVLLRAPRWFHGTEPVDWVWSTEWSIPLHIGQLCGDSRREAKMKWELEEDAHTGRTKTCDHMRNH
jgi:hypothetical protein